MGGGGGQSVTTPQLPPELRGLYRGVANNLLGYMGQMPLSGFFDMDPREIAGADPMQQAAYENVGALFGQSPSTQQAYDMFGRLGNMPEWQGTDLSSVGRPGGINIGMPGQQGGAGSEQTAKMAAARDPRAPGDVGGTYLPPRFPDDWQPGDPLPGDQLPGDPGSQPGGTREGGTRRTPGVGGDQPDAATLPFGQFQYTGGPTQQGPGQGMGRGPQTGGGLGDVNIPVWTAYTGGAGGQGPIPGREAPFQLPGREGVDQISMQEQIGQVQGPQNVESALMNIDFANHPALQSAMEAFQASSMPAIANQMAAAGLSRSGAASSAMANARAQMALPVMQQLMGLSVQERGQDIGQQQLASDFSLGQRGQDIGQRAGDIQALLGQRGQDIQSLLGQRGQDIEGLLGARGQDVTQRGQDITGALQNMGLGLQARGQDINALLTGRGQDLGARGQDLDALLQQGQQALAARGQDIGALGTGAQGMLGVNQADMSQLLAGLGQAGLFGGLMRDIGQQQTDAGFDEQMRQYNLARDLLFAPLGGLTSQVGSSTRSQEGK